MRKSIICCALFAALFAVSTKAAADMIGVWNFNESANTDLKQTGNEGSQAVMWDRSITGAKTSGDGSLVISQAVTQCSVASFNTLGTSVDSLSAQITLNPHSTSMGKLMVGLEKYENGAGVAFSGLYYERTSGYLGYDEGVWGGSGAVTMFRDLHSRIQDEPLDLRITFYPDASADVFFHFESDPAFTKVGHIANTHLTDLQSPSAVFGVDGLSSAPNSYLHVDQIEVVANTVPEPTTMVLLASGMAAFGLFRFRRKK